MQSRSSPTRPRRHSPLYTRADHLERREVPFARSTFLPGPPDQWGLFPPDHRPEILVCYWWLFTFVAERRRNQVTGQWIYATDNVVQPPTVHYIGDQSEGGMPSHGAYDQNVLPGVVPQHFVNQIEDDGN